jgi:hypothetical protein
MKQNILFFIFLLLFAFAGLNYYHNFLVKPSFLHIENLEEEFDAKLYKLNSLSKVLEYVNTQYGSDKIGREDSLKYANLMARTLRMRFYHGWSQYGFKDNWVLYLLSPVHEHALGIVEPNDILNYPEALCSQQAIVGMMALRSRGYTYRKVGFHNKERKMGHFTYEIKIGKNWHFYDLDKEPNLKVLEENNRPSIDSLAVNHELRQAAYLSHSSDIKDGLISNYNNNHPPNVFPATNMLTFHRVTLFLSYTLWIWLGLFLYIFYRHKKSKK